MAAMRRPETTRNANGGLSAFLEKARIRAHAEKWCFAQSRIASGGAEKRSGVFSAALAVTGKAPDDSRDHGLLAALDFETMPCRAETFTALFCYKPSSSTV
jgi:hypothetical protein